LQDDAIKKTIKSVSKLSKKFRDNALELRLIPVKVLILKLQRLVRDLSKSLNKEIEFITQGTHTELDKNIISKLESPLMHILRNSIDHGIEAEEERLKQGKPARGVVRFIAFYSGSNVFIQIQDDGRGIDAEKVKQKAIEKGLINKDDDPGKQDVFNLLFTPGFSTASKVSNVSGRGVGLDVVKKEITDMRGEIDIESEKGLGTSFTLKLPLTLSIIDTLRVYVNNTHILIPREYIVQTSMRISSLDKGFDDKFEFENQVIPVISLRNDFDASTENQTKHYNIIVKQYEKLYALQVDDIYGEHQAVVKPLGYYNHNHDYFSGASILGDGSLAFILDVNKVISNKKNKSSVGNYNLK
jgi:two-component system chemotaxis sensor kinase CheA